MNSGYYHVNSHILNDPEIHTLQLRGLERNVMVVSQQHNRRQIFSVFMSSPLTTEGSSL